jgi:hypothetical protein
MAYILNVQMPCSPCQSRLVVLMQVNKNHHRDLQLIRIKYCKNNTDCPPSESRNQYLVHDISQILCKPTFFYRGYKNPPLDLTQSCPKPFNFFRD